MRNHLHTGGSVQNGPFVKLKSFRARKIVTDVPQPYQNDPMMLKVSKLYQFVMLPGRVKWLYLNAALWLIAVKTGLHLLPFNRLRGWLARSGQPDEKPVILEQMREILSIFQYVGEAQ